MGSSHQESDVRDTLDRDKTPGYRLRTIRKPEGMLSNRDIDIND